VRELIERVDTNDPADAKIILIPLSAVDSAANAQDADTVTAALATAINEQTGGGWVRKRQALPTAARSRSRITISLSRLTGTT
jgi:hypothetical protein